MKKYILMALLPILLSGKIFGADLNTAIQSSLKSAQTAIKGADSQITLDSILAALNTHAQLGDEQYNVAMAQISSLQANLYAYRSNQYRGCWSNICWVFSQYPLSVVTEIDPAINKVNTAQASIIFNKYKGYGNDVVHIGKVVATRAALIALGAGLLYASQNREKLTDSKFWYSILTAPTEINYSNISIPTGFRFGLTWWAPFAGDTVKAAIKS